MQAILVEPVDLVPFRVDVETAWRRDPTLAALHEQLEDERVIDLALKSEEARRALLETLDLIVERKRAVRRALLDAA